MQIMLGVNMLVGAVDDVYSGSAASPALVALGGVLVVLVGPLSLVAGSFTRARLEGTTLVTKHVFVTRRADLATARVRIGNHRLRATDSVTGRAVELPLISGRAPLSSADLGALAAALRPEGRLADDAPTARATADALRELATDESLRHSLSGAKSGLMTTLFVLLWIMCGATVLLVLLTLLRLSS